MVRKVVSLVVFVPLGVLLVILAVANRAPVNLALNPFNPADQALSVSAPLFVLLILAVMLGVMLGAVVTWFVDAGGSTVEADLPGRSGDAWRPGERVRISFDRESATLLRE